LTADNRTKVYGDILSLGSTGFAKTAGTFAMGELATAVTLTSANGYAASTAQVVNPSYANEIVPSFGDLYANPAATQAMLDDAAFDVEAWLADEIASEFAKAEGAAFISGNGVNRPRGFLTAPVASTNDTTRPFGTLQYVPTGVAGGFAATNPQDKLVELVHAVRAPYRQGASWVMNASTLSVIRRFKTSDGAFIWQPGLAAGQPDTLMGYPVIEAEDMPDIAANSLSIAFGNFKAGYLIAERSETNILRDPYSNKPYVHFYATKRIGGALINSTAIKLMRFSLT
jgi:HK97 family phage major capsid protein